MPSIPSLFTVAIASLSLTVCASAARMELKIETTVYSGSDAGGTTFGELDTDLTGKAMTLRYRYDTAAIGPNQYTDFWNLHNGSVVHDNRYFSPQWYSPEQYPSFLGADLTINGITVAIDTTFRSVMDYVTFWNSLNINASDPRLLIDLNGGQHAEGASFSANGLDKPFNPLVEAVYQSRYEGFIRIYQEPGINDKGQYPVGRFSDGLLHWVNLFYSQSSASFSVKEVKSQAVGVPDSGATILLAAGALAGLGLLARRRA